MKEFWVKTSTLIEAFCNVSSAMLIFFMSFLLVSPLLELLEGRSGIGWILLTIVVMFVLYLVVLLGLEAALDILDRVRKGELLAGFFNPLRNISSVLGIYAVFKVEYFLIHSDKEPTPDSWGRLLWEFLTKL